MPSGPHLIASEPPQDAPPPEAVGVVKAFFCVHCGKRFTRKENLNRHAKTHDTRRSHQCQKCGRGFTRSDLLRRHEALHNSPDATTTRSSDLERPSKRTRFDLDDPEPSSDPLRSFQSPGFLPQSLPSDFPTTSFREGNAMNIDSDNHQLFSAHLPAHAVSAGSDSIQSMQGLTPQDPYFDFSTFTLPAEYGMPEGFDHWFSLDFYSALQETDWEAMAGLGPQQIAPAHRGIAIPQEVQAHFINEDSIGRYAESENHPYENHIHKVREDRVDCDHQASGRISRLTSPPNEASYEDRTPFAWNPRSRRIVEAKDIVLSPDDPLLKDHNPRFDITEPTFQRVKMFLLPRDQPFSSSIQDTFNLPDLPITNGFISKFFERFAPQAPVLHTPTLDMNKDLPPPLLAVMIVIGAIYSRLRHTRRFAIIALDRVRRHLQIAIEDDNVLMRDHMIIYAAALICYTGLWCGNKRAFELAEILRGAVVTYVRRLDSAESSYHKEPTSHGSYGQQDGLKSQWHQWAIQESRKRLFWFVYSIDCQFPSLLNIAPLMSPTEVSTWDCPCDEEFWRSRSARHWKSLLGTASIPPSRSFAAAIAPFTRVCCTCRDSGEGDNCGTECQSPPLNLNAWSYFLVMMNLQVRIFQYGEERLLTRRLALFDNGDESDSEKVSHVHGHLRAQESTLEAALSLWSGIYAAQLPSPQQSDSTSLYFHHASAVLGRLSRAYLNVPITDLQEAIGKGGNTLIQPAMSRLRDWIATDPEKAQTTVVEAFNTIERIVWFQQHQKKAHCGEEGRSRPREVDKTVDTSPYNSITLFLCYIMLWAFATVANDEQKRALSEVITVRENEYRSRSLQQAMCTALGKDGNDLTRDLGSAESQGPRVIFKHAAQVLTRFGDWGCALNLALLLHWRSEM